MKHPSLFARHLTRRSTRRLSRTLIRTFTRSLTAVIIAAGLSVVLCVGGSRAQGASSVILDLGSPLFENNIARFPIEATFLPMTPGLRMESFTLSLFNTDASLTTGGTFTAFEFVPDSPTLDNWFGHDTNTPSGQSFNFANPPFPHLANMFVDLAVIDGLPNGTHLLGTIDLNMLQAGLQPGQAATLDISHILKSTSGLNLAGHVGVGDPNDLIFFEDVTPTFANSGRQSFTVPTLNATIPEPATLSLLALVGALIMRRRRCTR